MSAVFVHSDEQRRLAEETAAAAGKAQGKAVTTVIADLDRFYIAEAYHQKYYLRRHAKVTAEFEAIYPNLDAFVRSTAVTRANALVGGDLGSADFDALRPDLGLSDGALAELGRTVR